jgi:hypothetical protein
MLVYCCIFCRIGQRVLPENNQKEDEAEEEEDAGQDPSTNAVEEILFFAD